jgi:hypothetical protein
MKRRKVVSLRGAAIPIPERCPAAIEELSGFLTEARSGNVAGVGLFVIRPNGHVTTSWAGSADRHSMIAGVSILQHRMMKAAVE